MQTEDWFLSALERGNPKTRLPAWCGGNQVEPLVHGAAYFDRLVDEVEALAEGDHLFFIDWCGDSNERMRRGGMTLVELFCQAAARGVVVKGLVWRSHLDKLRFTEEENRRVAESIEAAGGEVLLDQRVRLFGSHHQKLVVLRHPGRPERDVAFVGGIDLCRSRRDNAKHVGDPQALAMAAVYGGHPPWHDVQLAVHGPVVGALDATFRERWEDPHRLDSHRLLAWLRDRLRGTDLTADPLPPQPPDPPAGGPHAVQVLRTYPVRRPRYEFAPAGERSVAHGYAKALRRARRLVYVEDQYLWSSQVTRLFADALRQNSQLHLVIVVPRHPDVDGLELPPNLIGRVQAMHVLRRAGGDRVHLFDVENHDGVPVYVHAKVCVVDDVWACVGSAPTSTDGHGRTTARCRARCSTASGTRGHPRIRPAAATAHGCSPETCGCGCGANISTAHPTAARTRICWTRSPQCGR